jgi:hypothetical protein
MGIPRPQLDMAFEVRLPDGRIFQRTFAKSDDVGESEGGGWASRRRQ